MAVIFFCFLKMLRRPFGEEEDDTCLLTRIEISASRIPSAERAFSVQDVLDIYSSLPQAGVHFHP